MCDDWTERENAKHLKFTRREVSAGAGAVAATWLTACTPPADPARAPHGAAPGSPGIASPDTASSGSGSPATGSSAAGQPAAQSNQTDTVQRAVRVETPDGVAEGLFMVPRGGKHPGVLMWPDVAGLRPAFEQMANRLAGEGFAVLLVNPYYRSAKLPLFQTFAEWQTESGKEKIKPMREELTAERVASDGRAFVTWLTRQPEVDDAKKLGTAGYCMSGPFTFHTAAATPNEVGALASFHGGGLATAEPTSPHQRLKDIRAAILVCIAENDDQRDPDAKDTLRSAAAAANVPAEIEVYPAQHGFCVTDSPVYSKPQAERAWSRMLETFRTRL